MCMTKRGFFADVCEMRGNQCPKVIVRDYLGKKALEKYLAPVQFEYFV